MPHIPAFSRGDASGLTGMTASAPQNRRHLLTDALATTRPACSTIAGSVPKGENDTYATTPAASWLLVTINHVTGTTPLGSAVVVTRMPPVEPIRV